MKNNVAGIIGSRSVKSALGLTFQENRDRLQIEKVTGPKFVLVGYGKGIGIEGIMISACTSRSDAIVMKTAAEKKIKSGNLASQLARKVLFWILGVIAGLAAAFGAYKLVTNTGVATTSSRKRFAYDEPDEARVEIKPVPIGNFIVYYIRDINENLSGGDNLYSSEYMLPLAIFERADLADRFADMTARKMTSNKRFLLGLGSLYALFLTILVVSND